MGKIIVIRKADRILVFTFSDYRPDALQVFFSPGKGDLVGNVYVGRVDRVLPSMGAGFVAVQKDRKVYLPLPSCKDRSGNTVIWNGKPDDALKAGDEILVQIERMGMGDKLPTARTDITGLRSGLRKLRIAGMGTTRISCFLQSADRPFFSLLIFSPHDIFE